MKLSTYKQLYILLAIAGSGFGVGCGQSPQSSDVQLIDELVVQDSAPAENTHVEIVNDSKLRYFLDDKAIGFVVSKGWPVESITDTAVTFSREDAEGFTSLTVAAEEGRTPQEFINDAFPNGDYDGKVYDGALHGQNGRYLTSNGGAGSFGVFAQMLNGKLVSVQYATNASVADVDFRGIIASLSALEVE